MKGHILAPDGTPSLLGRVVTAGILYGGGTIPQSNQRQRMYSPKIDEALIPLIYRAAKAAKIPMTVWVSRAVQSALPKEGDTVQPHPLIVLNGSSACEQPHKSQIPA